MAYRTVAIILAFVMGNLPLAAQSTCDLAAAAKRIDDYAAAPFSARTWRVLKGLGDPDVGDAASSNRWNDEDSFLEIATRVVPNVTLQRSIGYDCRIGYPLAVLKRRIQDYGEESPYIKQWVRSQIAVFAACGGDTQAVLPPPLATEGVPADVQQQDRAYQQAALTFYRERDKALEQFKAIGASNSPHRAAGRYMVANIQSNAKRIGEARTEAKAILADQSLSSVHAITQELLGYIANLEDTAEGWSELLDTTIKVIEAPAASILDSEKMKSDYARALNDIDFAGIRAKHDDWWLDGKLPENPTISKAIVDASRKHTIVPWMIAGQTANDYYNSAGWALIGPQWQARIALLIERATTLVPGTPDLASDVIGALRTGTDVTSVKVLLEKARGAASSSLSTCGTAPETAAAGVLTLHAVRVAAMSGQFDAAYALIEAYPFKRSIIYRNGTVLALGRYLLGQGNLAEARRFRDRLVTADFLKELDGTENESLRGDFAAYLMWIAEDRVHWDAGLALHPHKTERAIMNFLPVNELRTLASDELRFSAAERALLIRAAWTRVYALGKKPEQSLSDALFKLNPELLQITEDARSDYPRASDAHLRLLTILRTPRFNTLVNGPGTWQPLAMTDVGESPQALDQYDHNDRNWWCPFEPDRHLGALRSEFDFDSGAAIQEWMKDEMKPVLDPALKASLEAKREATLKAHPLIRSISWKEIGALTEAPGAPRRLTERTIVWAKASNGSDGAPEALALSVRATRYGCNWHGGHKAYSKPAQELLQTRFKATVWAGQTPYWFDCMRQKWPESATGYTKIVTCETITWPKQKLPR